MFEYLPWAFRMMRVRKYEHQLGFAAREVFHDALRHQFKDEGGSNCGTVAYPDAFYYITDADLKRAKAAVENDQGVPLFGEPLTPTRLSPRWGAARATSTVEGIRSERDKIGQLSGQF